ncbi:regulation of nuclear pre-mRNA domain-containing protein 2-like [Lethenteron reissneri]|uniref:regulation of nuclear pre-mRNA domain-containing protein 2-like n=1 Tax=Lethenteron reissneri TaxID=7753 RepID=UPI002AB7BCCD|nr:regulation of nuclear pre-mRNA domain-containing protein 2-like [Lethenteron reissneri]
MAAAPGFAESLERKLSGLSNTMESIQGLSHWIIDHKSRSAKIVERWLKFLKKSPCEQRLNLFYLANDVVQNCKRKDAIVFRDAFAEVLPDATSLVRDIAVRKPIERIFGIWEQREIFKKDFTVKLREILVNEKARAPENANVLAEFRPHSIIQQLTAFKTFEDESMTKETQAANLQVEFLSVEDFKLIKDQEGGMLFSNELEETSAKLEDFVDHLEKDIKRLPVIMDTLEKAELFYESQFKDVKIVVNAYTNFGNRVVHLKRQLEELVAKLPGLSPMMSPPAGIHSPAGSDSPMAGPEGSPFSPPLEDIDLPDDDADDTVTSAATDTSSKKSLLATVTVQSTSSARAMKLGNRQLHANKTSTIPSLPDLDLRKLSGVIGSFTGFSSLLQEEEANADVQDSASASPPADSFEGSDSETLSPSMSAAGGVSSSHSVKSQKIKSPSSKSVRSSTDSCGDEFTRHQCFSPMAEKQSTDTLETNTVPESSSSSSLESRIHSMLKDNPTFLPFSLGSPVRAADENPYNADESAPSSRTAFEGSSPPVSTPTFEKPRVRRASMASNKSTSSIPSLTAIKETPIPSIASDRPSPIPSLAQNRTIPKYSGTLEIPAHIPTLMGIGRTEKQDEDNLFANERGSGTPTQDEPSDHTAFSQTGDASYSTFPQYAMTGYPLSNHTAFQSSQESLQSFYSAEEERQPATRTAARKMSSNLLVLSNSCSNEDDNENANDTGYSRRLGAPVGNTDDFQFHTVAGAKAASNVGTSSDVHNSWGYEASASTNQNQSQMAMNDVVTTSPYSHFGYTNRPPVQSPTSQLPFHSNLASEIHHYMVSHLSHTNPLLPPNPAAFELGPFSLAKPVSHPMAVSPHQILSTHPTLMPHLPHLRPLLVPPAHQVPLSPTQPILASHPHLILQQPMPVHTPTSRSVQTPPFRTVSSQSPVQHPSLPPGYVVAPHLLPTPSPKRPHFTPHLPTSVSAQAQSLKAASIKQRAHSHPTPQLPSHSVPHSKLHFSHTQKLSSHHSRSKYSFVREKVHTTVKKAQKEEPPKDGLEKNEGKVKTPSSSSNSDQNVQSNKHKTPTQEIGANQSQAEIDSGISKEEKREQPQNQPDPGKKCGDALGNNASSSGADKPQVATPQEDQSKPYPKDGFQNKLLANHVSPSSVDFPPQPRPLVGQQFQGSRDFRPRALLANPRIPFDGGIKRPGPPFGASPSLPKRPFMPPPRY